MPPPKRWRTCANCGERYYGHGLTYCSQSCRTSSVNRRRTKAFIPFVCPECGIALEVKPHWANKRKYCSRDCAASAQRKRVTKACEVCGKRFSVKPHEATDRRYCSKTCYGEAISVLITRKCEQCDEPFRTYQEAIDGGNGRYCSRECAARARRTMVAKRCETCNEPFEVKPSWLERGEGRYCSSKCYFAARGETSIERLVREELERRGMVFEQEKRFHRWVADFFLPDYNVVIEADGEYWHSLPKAIRAAKRKDRYLKAQGIRVYRFAERDIRADVSSLVDEVLRDQYDRRVV